MSRVIVALIVLVFGSQAVAAPPPSTDSTDPDEDVVDIPTVVVDSARRVEDHAAPSTVISRDSVTDAVASLPEILDEQPGLRIQRLGGLESYSTVSIRGSSAEQVLVTLDGIPLNSAEGGGVDLSTIPFGPLERVVVYRGVTPLSFGSSAIGGVVSLHSRTLQKPWLELEAGGGSFGTRLARGFGGHGSEDWGVGVAVDYLGSQGNFAFQDDQGTLFQNQDDEETERQNNAFDQTSVLVKAHWDWSNDWRLGVMNWFLWRDQGLPGVASNPTEKASLKRVSNMLGFRLHGSPSADSPLDVAVIPYVSWSQTTLSDPLSETGFGADNIKDQSLAPGISSTLKWPLFFSGSPDTVLTPGVNAAYRYERFVPEDLSTAQRFDASERHRVTAALELDFDWGPAETQVLISGRYEKLWNDVEQPGNRPVITEPPKPKLLSDAWTIRGGLVNRSIPWVEWRANAAYGVRFPSLYELFGNNGSLLGNPGLGPERGWNVDTGLVFTTPKQWRPNHWSVELFGFARWTDDLIHFIQNSQGISVAQNIASSRIFGVELGTYCDVLRHIRGRGSATWIHSEDRSDNPARRGNILPQQPTWKVYGRLETYLRMAHWISELGVSADIEFVSGNFRDPANLVEVPERWLVGAGLYLRSKSSGMRMDVTLRNLTNQPVLDYTGFPLPGLSVMATLRYAPLVEGDKSS